MKIVFMGTPDFSVPCLDALIDEGHELCAVFTREDKPKNRGMAMQATPVKEVAIKHGIQVFQPKSLKKGDSFEILEQINPDLIVVVAYGLMLPKRILDLPKYGCVNVHASLLPKYRGASPIQTAIVMGEAVTGVTIMQMDEGMDTGDMLLCRQAQIEPCDTGDTLHNKLSALGATALVECIELMEQNRIEPKKQDDELATYAHMISKGDGQVDFANTAKAVANQIMGYTPWPGAYCQIGDTILKLFEAYEAKDVPQGGAVGKIEKITKDGAYISCSDSCVLICEVQKAGGKRMRAEDFFRGRADLAQGIFGNNRP